MEIKKFTFLVKGSCVCIARGWLNAVKKIASLKNFSLIYDTCKELLKEIKFDFRKGELYILGFSEDRTLQMELTCKVEVETPKVVILGREVFKKFSFDEMDFYDADDHIIAIHGNMEGKLRPDDPRTSRMPTDPYKIKWDSWNLNEIKFTVDELKQLLNLIKGEVMSMDFIIKSGRLTMTLDISESKFSIFKEDIDPKIDCAVTVSTDLIADGLKMYNKFKEFTMFIGTDVPLLVKMSNADLKVDILIAPRIKAAQ